MFIVSQLGKNAFVHIGFRHVIFIIIITGAKVRPHIQTGIVDDHFENCKYHPRQIEDTLYKIATVPTQKPQKQATCPHCSKTGGLGKMNQYHFDRCKDRPDQTSENLLYRKQKLVICPHCDKEGGIVAMMHYHFDKCKLFTSMIQ